jgi:hypothetical protein
MTRRYVLWPIWFPLAVFGGLILSASIAFA